MNSENNLINKYKRKFDLIKTFLIVFVIVALIMILITIQPVIWNDFKGNVDSSERNLKSYTKDLSEINRTNTKWLRDTVDYITWKLDEIWVEHDTEQYSYNWTQQRNIVVHFEWRNSLNKQKKNNTIVIWWHYDSAWNMPWADDNASAVAWLLEICRILKDSIIPNQDIEVVFFPAEEPPYFRTEWMWSYQYINNIKSTDKEIELAIILEMIWYYSEQENSQDYPIWVLKWIYPNKWNFITIVSNYENIKLTRNIKSYFKKSLSKNNFIEVKSINASGIIPWIDFSDHMNFWKFWVPAVMITDTSFYRNKNYHTINDTYEKLDYKKMKEVIDATIKSVLSL